MRMRLSGGALPTQSSPLLMLLLFCFFANRVLLLLEDVKGECDSCVTRRLECDFHLKSLRTACRSRSLWLWSLLLSWWWSWDGGSFLDPIVAWQSCRTPLLLFTVYLLLRLLFTVTMVGSIRVRINVYIGGAGTLTLVPTLAVLFASLWTDGTFSSGACVMTVVVTAALLLASKLLAQLSSLSTTMR
jgi:hypothetical protein